MVHASTAFWKEKRVFLTGHTGFKGSWLSLWLTRMGAEVMGYALAPPSDPNLFKLADLSSRMSSVTGEFETVTGGRRMDRALARAEADLERLVEDVALSSVEERLARALLRLAGQGRTVDATHESLATEIGSGRAVVSRQLASFARDGLIESERGHIVLTDPATLRALAHTAD